MQRLLSGRWAVGLIGGLAGASLIVGVFAGLIENWIIVAVSVMILQVSLLAIAFLMYRRMGGLTRAIRREAGKTKRLARRIHRWPRPATASDVDDALQRTVVLTRNQSNARLDLIEEQLAEQGSALRHLMNLLSSDGGESIHREVQQLGEAIGGGIEDLGSRIESSIRTHSDAGISETDALLQLKQMARIVGPTPLLAGWAIAPTGMLQILKTAFAHEPRMVLELGSGASTIYLADAFRDREDVRIVSLDHDADFAEATRSALRANGLDSRVEVRHAPLEPLILKGWAGEWYDLDAVADLVDIDFLVVDGPPKRTCELARYPAGEVLAGRFAESCIVMMDDASRHDERQIVQMWLKDDRFARGRSAVQDQAILTFTRDQLTSQQR